MRELIDCHVHTELSGHGTGSVGQIVSAAIFKGLTGLVLTEHLPLPQGIDPEHHISMPLESLPVYVEDVRAWATKAKGLEVVVGGEADWIPGKENETLRIQRAARSSGVDVLLGSVHFLGEWAFDDPHSVHVWDEHDVDEVYRHYFTEWCAAARSGLFDVMAHPDVVKKFGHRPAGDPRELYEAAARAAVDGGVLIEVSTAGLRKPVGELYPAADLLAAFAAAGIGATVGSDAHSTDEVGLDIERAYEALFEAGYREVRFPTGRHESRSIAL